MGTTATWLAIKADVSSEVVGQWGFRNRTMPQVFVKI